MQAQTPRTRSTAHPRIGAWRGAALAASLLTSLALASSAAAEIYEWIDANGRHHYTQRLDDVPPAQRAAAEAAAGARPTLIQAAPSSARGPAAPGAEARGQACVAGRGCANTSAYDPAAQRREQNARREEQREERARQHYRKLVARVETLEQKVAALLQVGADSSPGSRRSNVSSRNHARYRARHSDYKRSVRDLENAREDLAAYEEEIRRAGLPPGVMR